MNFIVIIVIIKIYQPLCFLTCDVGHIEEKSRKCKKMEGNGNGKITRFSPFLFKSRFFWILFAAFVLF